MVWDSFVVERVCDLFSWLHVVTEKATGGGGLVIDQASQPSLSSFSLPPQIHRRIFAKCRLAIILELKEKRPQF